MTRHVSRKRGNDYYYQLAKREGYRSRSAYKLLQISKRYNPIKQGDVVLDLGCSPGGWMQVSSQLVGDQGYVLGIDKRPVKGLQQKNTKTIVADVEDPETVELITDALPRKADVLLSDLSPNVSGIWQIDHLNQIDLARAALSIAGKVLKHNGKFLTKTFQGESTNQFVRELRNNFSNVRMVRPQATRKRSAEMYLLATGFRGGKVKNSL